MTRNTARSVNAVFAVLAVLALLAAAAPAAAQPAALTGAVLDPDGRPAPNATVLVSDQHTVRATAVTGAQGRFRIADLPAGRYEIRVALDGFSATPATVDLAPGAARDLTVSLQVSAVGESVVVTAAGRELPRSRVTDSVTVVTGNDIAARQFETVADALRYTVPGLGVTANGGRGSQTSLLTRGGESDFTLVMIDGVRVNDFGGAYDFAHLPVADIERIEVVRGPQSAMYGSDAIGGVVQIITKQGGPAHSRSVTRCCAAPGTRARWNCRSPSRGSRSSPRLAPAAGRWTSTPRSVRSADSSTTRATRSSTSADASGCRPASNSRPAC